MKILIFFLVLGLVTFLGIQTVLPSYRAYKMELDTIHFVKQDAAVLESYYFTAGEPYDKRDKDRRVQVLNFAKKHAEELGVTGEVKDVAVQINRTGLPMSPGDMTTKMSWTDKSNFIIYKMTKDFQIEFKIDLPAAMASGGSRRMPVQRGD